MIETLIGACLALLAAVIALLIALWRRTGRFDPSVLSETMLKQAADLARGFEAVQKDIERIERAAREEMGRNREEMGGQAKQAREEMVAHAKQARDETSAHAKQTREEMGAALRGFNDSVVQSMTGVSTLQKNQLESFARQIAALTQSSEAKLEALRGVIEQRLKEIQEDNTRKLDLMRATVDEKLQSTLERRLGESFKQVSDRLEQVHKGLGEMQSLATGVGDLKRVLTNVKTRGAWGEVQLGALLEQILTPGQYETNVATRPGSAERVEFAIKLPGRDAPGDLLDGGRRPGQPVWLPIDAKFPQEDYLRLLDAQEKADPEGVEAASRSLEKRLTASAKDIRDKYLDPPHTTDFALLFLPTEGLYAETLRRPGLSERLQRDFRVVVAGPTTLAALLNSLQMGFRTLAIQERSSEVWGLLGAVKTEFARFGDILAKVRKNLEQATNTIDQAASKSRTIERRLKNVQELPAAEAGRLLPDSEQGTMEETEHADSAENRNRTE